MKVESYREVSTITPCQSSKPIATTHHQELENIQEDKSQRHGGETGVSNLHQWVEPTCIQQRSEVHQVPETMQAQLSVISEQMQAIVARLERVEAENPPDYVSSYTRSSRRT